MSEQLFPSPAGPADAPPLVLDTTLRQLRDPRPAVRVGARFAYRPQSPFAVQLTLWTPGRPTVWHLSRELLTRGTRVRCGIGEVRVWPETGPGRAGVIALRLGPPDGYALLHADRANLVRWLDDTADAVPPGTESCRVDWDAVIGRLLTS